MKVHMLFNRILIATLSFWRLRVEAQNKLMSQECKISDWRVNYTRAITEGDEYPAMAS